MYNSFLHDRIKTEEVKQISYNKKSQQLRKKFINYRDKLIHKYDKRIETFIYKMQQQPLIITNPDQNKLKNTLNPFRTNFNSKFMQKSRLIFKQSQDWKSMLTSAERMERSKNSSLQLNKNQKFELLYRDLRSQQLYQGKQRIDKFRGRQKQKQIHQIPMRFTIISKTPKMHIPKLKESTLIKNKNQQQDEYLKRNNTTSSMAYQDQISSQTSKLNNKKGYNIQRKQLNQSKLTQNNESRGSSYGQRRSNLGMGSSMIIERQRNVDLNQKMHFNAVLDLAIRKKKLSKHARKILQKCNYIKPLNKQQQSQSDMFEKLGNLDKNESK